MPSPNVVASVRAKLTNRSREIGVSNEMVMRRYAYERLLARLSESRFTESLCLKGAMAFLAITGDDERPTRDMDFTGAAHMPAGETLDMFRDIASVDTGHDDGLTFLLDTFEVSEIQENSEEPGHRIMGMAMLGTSRIPLKLEVSYGHSLTPGAVLMDYPTLIDGMPVPKVICYSAETVLAEKFEAVCSLGERNSRYKDFYDLRGLARSVDFDVELAANAMRDTFAKRGTPLPEGRPPAFEDDFISNGNRHWDTFMRRTGKREKPGFSDVMAEIEPLLKGVLDRALGRKGPSTWKGGQGWSEERPAEEVREFVPF